jgi:hypothetical protein
MRVSCRLLPMTRAFFPLMIVAGCRGRPSPEPIAREAPAPAAPTAADRPAVVASSQGPFASAVVARGELAGVVVDAETGRPLPLVQVAIVDAAGSALSDSSGHFQLRLPNVPVKLYVRRIGYEIHSTVVTPHADSGSAVVFALRQARNILCSVTSGGAPMQIAVGPNGRQTIRPLPTRVERHPGVVVMVRDAMTGRAPPGAVAVSVRNGAFSDSVMAQPDSGNRAVAMAALERPGHYEVTVRSEGYREWTGSASTRIASECGGELIPAVFHACLIPR